jgi:PAS domain S-box-containing protein
MAASAVTGPRRTGDQLESTEPHLWRWILVAVSVCALPLLLVAAGVDLSTASDSIPPAHGFSIEAAYQALRGSHTHTLLEWTAVCAAAFVGLLTFVQYRLTREPSLPVIGVALVCAGAMDAFHTLAADRLIDAVANNRDLIPFTWAICRLFNAVILLFGVGMFAFSRQQSVKGNRGWYVAGISAAFVLIAYTAINICATSATLPRTMFADATIKRPYDIIPILPYLLCLTVAFPKYYKRYRSTFALSLVVSMIPQIATQLYMAFGSFRLHDASFNIAHALKAVAYGVPIAGLLMEYAATFRKHERSEGRIKEYAAKLETSGAELQIQKLAMDEHAIVSIADIRGNITYVNDKFCDISGYTREELIGKNHRIVKSDEHAPAFYREMWLTISSGKVWRGEVKNIKKGGGFYWVDATVAPSKDANGKITQYVSMRSDITSRKNIEQQIAAYATAVEASNEELIGHREEQEALNQELYAAAQQCEEAMVAAECANRAKSDFLANMSHEIRTPMTAIMGFAEMLREDDNTTLAPGERKEAIDTIRRNGEYLLGIINDILDLSKIEAGKMTVEQIECRPGDVLAEVAALVSIKIEAKGLVFNTEYIGAIPEVIRTDATRLRQILINLVGNAIKFTEVGGVRLIVRFVDDSCGPHLQFDVIDTGVGMTEEQAAKLFQPFAQADTSTTRKFGGTGLGLTISKRFAEMLGGNITVIESAAGVGTRFRATIATGSIDGVKMLDSPIAKPAASPAKSTPAAPDDSLPLQGCRLLYAEDGPDNQRLVSHILKKAGAQVTMVENGRLAVDKVMAASGGDEAFDIILMDMQMPVLDGYGATRELRDRGYTSPIIALTAHAMASDRDKCIAVGCDDYATKPIDRKELIATIQSHRREGVSA